MLNHDQKLLLLQFTTRGRQSPVKQPTGPQRAFPPLSSCSFILKDRNSATLLKKTKQTLYFESVCFFLVSLLSCSSPQLLVNKYNTYFVRRLLFLETFLPPLVNPPLLKKKKKKTERKKLFLWFNLPNRHSAGEPEKYSDFTERRRVRRHLSGALK